MRKTSALTSLVLWAALAATALGAEASLPYHWYVNANGAEGTLDIATASGGRVTGNLLGAPVTGWLVGRHLVLVRKGSSGDETWEGWVATADHVEHGGQPVIAGTFIRPGADGPLPWFGAARSVRELAAAAPRPQLPPDVSHRGAGTIRTGTPPQTHPTPPRAAPRLATGQPSVAGTWETPDGPLEIRQAGSRLTFVLPDREVSGRLTGSDTLIGGFGPGCCKGRLEQAYTVISWDNGVKWYRR